MPYPIDEDADATYDDDDICDGCELPMAVCACEDACEYDDANPFAD